MKLHELVNEGWFGKDEEPKNEVITDDDRKLIKSVFKSGHNADLKSGKEPLFPENVHVVTDTKHISFYKRKGQLKASVGHYRSGEAGDPKKRPITHTDHDINSAEDLKSLTEGWKMGAAAIALSGAVAVGIANSPKVEINGEKYDKAVSMADAPDRAKTATVEINGKKTRVKYWEKIGHKGRKTRVYAIDSSK